MNRLFLSIVFSFLSTLCFAQVVRQGEVFTDVFIVDDKVAFIKEIPLVANTTLEANFKVLNEWAKVNYGKDPFVSSVRSDSKKKEIISRSRVELLLPVNSGGIREKIIMRYRVNGFLYQDKCVLEITDIAYLYENQDKAKQLPKVIRAEEFIINDALLIKDDLQEFRINTRKSTLFFLNDLAKNLETHFGL